MNNATPCASHCHTTSHNHSNLRDTIVALRYHCKARLQHWHINWRTRRQLAQLDSHQLQDIGINRGDAMEEASKPFWKN